MPSFPRRGRADRPALGGSHPDDGPMRFAEVKEAVPGMSDRLLSTRLKELETAGLVRREVHAGHRVRVTYGLTRKGDSLKPVMGAMRDWARRWHEA